MSRSHAPITPLSWLARGLAAGVIGTATMTAWQSVSARLTASEDDGEEQQERQSSDPWAEASAPAQVGRRILEGVFHESVSAEQIPLLTNVMHWSYGTGWGAAYGLLAGSAVRRQPLRMGLAFGSVVWAMSYVQLVPMGLYELPWRYPPQQLAMDLSYHLAYGAGLGVGLAIAERV